MEAKKFTPEVIEADLEKIDLVSNLMKDLVQADANDQKTMSKIDDFLSNQKNSESTKFDRSIINKASNVPNSSSSGFSSANTVLQDMERDATERAQKRKKLLNKIDELKQKGNQFFRNGDMTEAIDYYRKALEKCPKNELSVLSILHTNSAQALARQNQMELSLTNCDKALEYDPANHKALLHRGKLLTRLRRLDEARRCFSQLSADRPELGQLVKEYEVEIDRLQLMQTREQQAKQQFCDVDHTLFNASNSSAYTGTSAKNTEEESSNKDGSPDLPIQSSSAMKQLLVRLAKQNEHRMFYMGGLQLVLELVRGETALNLAAESAVNNADQLCSADQTRGISNVSLKNRTELKLGAKTAFKQMNGFRIFDASHSGVGMKLSRTNSGDGEVDWELIELALNVCVELAQPHHQQDEQLQLLAEQNQQTLMNIPEMFPLICQCLCTKKNEWRSKPPHNQSELLRLASLKLLCACSTSQLGRNALLDRLVQFDSNSAGNNACNVGQLLANLLTCIISGGGDTSGGGRTGDDPAFVHAAAELVCATLTNLTESARFVALLRNHLTSGLMDGEDGGSSNGKSNGNSASRSFNSALSSLAGWLTDCMLKEEHHFRVSSGQLAQILGTLRKLCCSYASGGGSASANGNAIRDKSDEFNLLGKTLSQKDGFFEACLSSIEKRVANANFGPEQENCLRELFCLLHNSIIWSRWQQTTVASATYKALSPRIVQIIGSILPYLNIQAVVASGNDGSSRPRTASCSFALLLVKLLSLCLPHLSDTQLANWACPFDAINTTASSSACSYSNSTETALLDKLSRSVRFCVEQFDAFDAAAYSKRNYAEFSELFPGCLAVLAHTCKTSASLRQLMLLSRPPSNRMRAACLIEIICEFPGMHRLWVDARRAKSGTLNTPEVPATESTLDRMTEFEQVVGNVCLVLINCAAGHHANEAKSELPDQLRNQQIIQPLLSIVVDAQKFDSRRNAAILVGKLAHLDSKYREQLSALNGFAILQKMSPS